MKVDPHVHSMERSPCGRSSERDMVLSAIHHGLDAIVFTDHGIFTPPERLLALNAEFAPFQVFGAIEITIRPELEDVLVIGTTDPALQERAWTYPELHAFVRARGGFMALAHPFRYKPEVRLDVTRYPPDAIELHSTNTGADDEPMIRALAGQCGAGLIVSSDAHIDEDVGIFFDVLTGGVLSERELAEALKAGRYSLESDPRRIKKHNSAVQEREALMREALARGESPEAFQARTGIAASRFRRVARGKSYVI